MPFVVVTPGFPKDESDTSCLPAFQQFALSLKKILPPEQLLILTFQYPFVKKEYSWNGIKVVALGGSNRPGALRVITWFRAYLALLKIHKKNKISGLLSLWVTECALVSDLFSKHKRIKHFIWIIGQDAKASNRYVKRVRPKAGQLIAMSDFIKEQFFKSHGILPFLVAENGVNPSIFPGLNTGEREVDISGAGSLIPLKNYQLFIEIISEVKKEFPALKVALAGGGPEEERLKQSARQLGLEDTIRFTGSLAHPAVLDLMNNSKVFLHTSVYEGNSTVLIEALYSGCQVVSTQALGNTDVKNLYINTDKSALIDHVREALRKNAPAERVTFNSMDDSAARILKLFAA